MYTVDRVLSAYTVTRFNCTKILLDNLSTNQFEFLSNRDSANLGCPTVNVAQAGLMRFPQSLRRGGSPRRF